jgi:hypothetical protein
MYQTSDDRANLQSGERDPQTRVVMDGQGNEWLVNEVETPQLWAHAKRCLIFSSSSIVRRVWRYPAPWARLSSQDLLALIDVVTGH